MITETIFRALKLPFTSTTEEEIFSHYFTDKDHSLCCNCSSPSQCFPRKATGVSFLPFLSRVLHVNVLIADPSQKPFPFVYGKPDRDTLLLLQCDGASCRSLGRFPTTHASVRTPNVAHLLQGYLTTRDMKKKNAQRRTRRKSIL